MAKSPVVILYDSSGNPVAVKDGDTVTLINQPVIPIAGVDGTTAKIIKVGSTGEVRIDPVGTTTQPISATSLPLPTGAATEATLATVDSVLDAIKDTAGIKKITDPLPAGTNNIGDVDVVSSALPTGAATESTLATRASAATQTDGSQKSQVVDSAGDGLEIDASGRAAIQNQPNMDVALSTRATESTLSAADTKLGNIDSVLDSIKDTDGIKKITDSLPAGTNRIGKVRLVDPSDVDLPGAEGVSATSIQRLLIAGVGESNLRTLALVEDTSDNIWRLAVQGKVSISAPMVPPATTAVIVAADTPLAIGSGSSPHDTEYVISNGTTFTLQSIVAGAEGDPAEGGSRIDVVYVDSGSTEHLVSREYINGFTTVIYPDTSKARDNTTMTGNGTTTKIIVRRVRLSGGSVEVDAVARGFEE